MGGLLDKNSVKIREHVSDWEDAIRKAGDVLVEKGSIKPAYVQQMIDSVKELGPYIVILPKFALAHAAPGDAVIRNDIGLITLDAPVCFGSENDPVSVVMCLACTDSASHVDRLSKIAEILMEESRMEQIIAAKKSEEITAIFQE